MIHRALRMLLLGFVAILAIVGVVLAPAGA